MLATAMTALAILSSPPPIEVQGHRGARALRPENTLPAFDYALSVGVDVLELDLHVTRDDHLVVTHDPALNPTICLGPGKKVVRGVIPIRTLTLPELAQYDCGSLKNPRFPNQVLQPGAKIPTLAQVIDLVKKSPHPAAKTVRLNIETKLLPSRPEWAPSPEAFARLLVAELKERSFLDRVIIQSFDHRSLAEVKRLAPKVPVATLTGEIYCDFVQLARAVGAEILSPDRAYVDRDLVEALHQAKVRVIPWTANTEAEWEELVELGVDGIITDDPAGLITYLKKRGRR